MKLYKNTLIVSIVIFVLCFILSVAFNHTCLCGIRIISFIADYMIGIACSIIVVIFTTFLQFKHEQKQSLKSILSDIQFFFFNYLLIVVSLDPHEDTPDKIWLHNYDETYKGIRKISSDLSDIEWFSKKKTKATADLQKSVLHMMVDLVKNTDRKDKNSMIRFIDSPYLKEIKDNAMLLASSNSYVANEIVHNYERIQTALMEQGFLRVRTISNNDRTDE